MNKPFYTLCAFFSSLLLIGGISIKALAQSADIYSFSASSGTFTEVTGGTEVSGMETDDGVSSVINIGFTFNYCGTDYTQVKASSNGWLSFNTSITSSNLSNGSTYLSDISPALMPLWDDLSGSVGEARYETTGTAPNRVFTLQWKNWRWNYNSSYPATISFQVKLYETTNVIDFIYRQETGTGNASGSSGASIGITSGTGIPVYLSLNNASGSPIASSSTFTDGITTRPATDQVYTFTPPAPCSGTPDPGSALSSVTSACASTPFTLSLSEPIVNSGLTFQWYSSPAGANTFTTITGATAATYTVANQTAATDYYCEVTCTGSSISANSDPVSVGQNPPNECYCIPSTSSGSSYYISNFTTTLGAININKSSSGSATGYQDFHTTDSIAIMQGSTFNYTITVAGGSTYGKAIWIDYNEDGIFQASEQVVSSNSYVSSPLSGSITVPLSTTPGSKRMRVIASFTPSNPSNACSNSGSGEYEDYTINVMQLPDCSGVPTTGTITGAPSAACPDAPFTMILSNPTVASGIIYQWYSSPMGANSFLPIAGANTISYTVTSQTAATDYFCEVTCNLSNETAYSDTVSVDENPPNECYCIPTTGGGSTYYISNFTTTGGAININKSSTGSSSGYQDFHATDSVVAILGTTINYSMTVAGGSTYGQAVWIDYNEDGVFQSTEQVVSSNSYISSPLSGSITPPLTTTPGSKRMRIIASFTPSNPGDPCTNSGSGEYEDYTFVVMPMPACSAVTFPDSVGTAVSPASLCISGDVHLNLASPMPIASGITYQWQRSTTATGTYTNIGTASATPATTYNTNTTYWYHCQIKCDGSTIITSTPVQVEAVVPETPVVTDGQHCGPGPVVLSGAVSSGNIFWYTDATSAVPIATGDSFTTPYLSATTTYYASAGAMPSIDTVVGNGASTGSSSVSPFYHVWGGYKHQYLILASDLQAAGITSGSISQIGFDVTSTNPNTTYNNFSISMGTTTDNSLTTYEPVTEVMAPTSITPTSGPFMIPLDNAFNWDGNSNLVIQICFSNENTGGTSVNVRYGSTSYTAHKYTYDDQTPVADLCTGTAGYNSSSNYLPNIYFHLSGCESERVLVTAYVRDTPSVDLGPDESLCGDANQSITLDAGNPGSTYLWNDGSTNQTLTVDQSGTYYVTVTNEYGCVSSDTTHKDILIAPNVHLGNDTTICNGVTLTLNAGDDGTIYYWSTGAHTHTIDVNHTGSYYVIVTNDLNCTVSDTINLTVNGTLPTINSIIIDNIGPYTFQFTAFNPQGAISGYHWDFGDGDSSNEVSPVHTYQSAGNYQVTLTIHTAMCGDLVYTSSTHIVGINDISVDDAVLGLYPNPAKDMITIENKGNFRMEELVITNAIGQIMARQTMENGSRTQQVNLSGYATGVYSVRIKTDKGYVVRRFEVLK